MFDLIIEFSEFCGQIKGLPQSGIEFSAIAFINITNVASTSANL